MEPPIINTEPAPPDVIFKAVGDSIIRQRNQAKKQVVYLTCDVCKIELAGQSVIDSHMAGSKHAKKLKSQEMLANLASLQQDKEKSAPFRCEACDVSLNSSTQFEVHCAGVKHRSKVGSGRVDKPNSMEEPDPALPAPSAPVPTPTVQPASAGSTKPSADLLYCAVCNVHVNSAMQLEQHVNSKKHRERESGRWSQRPAPYTRPSSRGGRGGLGSHSRGGKGAATKLTSLSNSFKSAGYSNTFIKPEGGVTMPKNSTNDNNSTSMHPSSASHAPMPRGPPRNKGNFGSLSPYVNSDSQFYGRGGFNARGGFHRGGWHAGNTGYGPPGPSGGYGDYGYDYNAGYENYGGFNEYNMMHAGPPTY